MDNKVIKQILQHEKERIDSLLKAIEREEKINAILEEGHAHDEDRKQLRAIFRYPWFYPDLDVILGELADIKERIGQQQGACRFTDRESSMMRLMVGPVDNTPNARATGIKEIREFTNKAKELIVIDPYIFGGEKDEVSSTEHIKDFEKSSRVDQSSLKKLHIIFSSKHGQTKNIKQGIKKLAIDNECAYSERDSDLIHDRIWIKDRAEAIVVGTSFGGLGNRLCFILDLPQPDLKALLEYLNSQALLS